ncbi:HsdM family class I SAM-dependent methyltransferase [Spiroplasma endosymbiont of Cantharis rufa]|uniref:HsdM family class I SAM-dependent methyltransferase n=1 Tax=Spiroplasma endosymbiont of Cantharis rufa TaxID=3066279 RepID=UPI0030D2B8B9
MENKKTGEVYTPKETVKKILDLALYFNENILKKYVIDNSCGEGAFLLEIVERYIDSARKIGLNNLSICKDLGKYIHGIEINRKSYLKVIENLNNLLLQKGIKNKVEWNIINENTLDVTQFNNKMDFVIGNPPYVRIHDLDFNYKSFEFSKKGMTDLYIIFFELGLKMLNKKGKLAYITPNSFLSSESGLQLRLKLLENNLIEKVLNLRNDNPFKGITTYPIITILNKNKISADVEVYNSNYDFEYKIEKFNYWIHSKFFFEKSYELEFIKQILDCKNLEFDIHVRNGLATNADKLFYNPSYKGKFMIDAIKASRGAKTKLFYPYDKKGNLIELEKIEKYNLNMFKVLKKNKSSLINRSLEDESKWYGFARSQGIKDVFRDKLSINTIIKDLDSLKIELANSGVAVYSGLYVYSNTIELNEIAEMIRDNEFITYIKCLGKDKSGKYYFISSQDLKTYLNYVYNNKNKNKLIKGEMNHNEQRFTEGIRGNNLFNK